MDGSIVMALATPPDAPEEPAQPPRFAVGARVEARFEAGETWYAGVIERVDGDAYDVAYDDGDHESNVAAALVREEVVTTRSLDVGPAPVPTSPEPSVPKPTPEVPAAPTPTQKIQEPTPDVAPAAAPTPTPKPREPTPKRPERTIDVAPPRRPPAEPRESAELLNVADAVAPEEDASDGGTAVAPNATTTPVSYTHLTLPTILLV